MYGGKGYVKGITYCPKCCKYRKSASYLGRMYYHVFLIPLIPDGPRVRIIKECSRCGNSQHITEDNLPAAVASLSKQAQYALAELLDGHQRLKLDDDDEVSSAFYLVNLVEKMLTFDMGKELAEISAKLRERGLKQLQNLIEGRILEFKGNLKGARAAYQAASDYPPREAKVYMILAGICMRMKDITGAKDAYQKALPITTDRYSIFLQLLEVYSKTKEWLLLAEAYEECFKVRPDLARENLYYKPYAKACKHCAKQPIGALDFK